MIHNLIYRLECLYLNFFSQPEYQLYAMYSLNEWLIFNMTTFIILYARRMLDALPIVAVVDFLPVFINHQKCILFSRWKKSDSHAYFW